MRAKTEKQLLGIFESAFASAEEWADKNELATMWMWALTYFDESVHREMQELVQEEANRRAQHDAWVAAARAAEQAEQAAQAAAAKAAAEEAEGWQQAKPKGARPKPAPKPTPKAAPKEEEIACAGDCHRKFRLSGEEVAIYRQLNLQLPRFCRRCRPREPTDVEIQCASCRRVFPLSQEEHRYFSFLGQVPKQCSKCRDAPAHAPQKGTRGRHH
ncbi:MAG: hypothetical protein ACYCOU_02600 [Sulfobacillus sp.]